MEELRCKTEAVDTIQTEVVKLQQESQQQQEHTEQLTAKMAELDATNVAKAEELEAANTKVAMFEKQQQEQQEQQQAQQEQQQAQQERQQLAEKQLQELELAKAAELKAAEELAEQLKQDHEQQLDAKTAEFETGMSGLRTELDAKAAELDANNALELEAKVAECEAKTEALEGQLGAKSEELEAKSAELVAAAAELVDANNGKAILLSASDAKLAVLRKQQQEQAMAQEATVALAKMASKRELKAKDADLKAAEEKMEQLKLDHQQQLDEAAAKAAEVGENESKLKEAEIASLTETNEGVMEQMSQQSAKVAELTVQVNGLSEDKKQWAIEMKGLQEKEQTSFQLRQVAEDQTAQTQQKAREAAKTVRDVTDANKELKEQNDKLVGHQNPRQKIQLHVKIKEENNQLRDQTEQQRHELRRLHKKLKDNGIVDDKAEEMKEKMDVANKENGGAEGGKKEDKKQQELAKMRRTLCTIVDRVHEVCGKMDAEPVNMQKLGSNSEEIENLTMSLLEGLEMKQKELTTSTVGKEREIVDLSNQLRLIQFGGDC
jgi:hypothetical protein